MLFQLRSSCLIRSIACGCCCCCWWWRFPSLWLEDLATAAVTSMIACRTNQLRTSVSDLNVVHDDGWAFCKCFCYVVVVVSISGQHGRHLFGVLTGHLGELIVKSSVMMCWRGIEWKKETRKGEGGTTSCGVNDTHKPSLLFLPFLFFRGTLERPSSL